MVYHGCLGKEFGTQVTMQKQLTQRIETLEIMLVKSSLQQNGKRVRLTQGSKGQQQGQSAFILPLPGQQNNNDKLLQFFSISGTQKK